MYRDHGPYHTRNGRWGKLHKQLRKEVEKAESSVKHTCFWILSNWGGKCNREDKGWHTLKAPHCRSHRGGQEMNWKGIKSLDVLRFANKKDFNKCFCFCEKSIQSPVKEAPSPYFWGDADSDYCQFKTSMLEPCVTHDTPGLVFILHIKVMSLDEQLGRL